MIVDYISNNFSYNISYEDAHFFKHGSSIRMGDNGLLTSLSVNRVLIAERGVTSERGVLSERGVSYGETMSLLGIGVVL